MRKGLIFFLFMIITVASFLMIIIKIPLPKYKVKSPTVVFENSAIRSKEGRRINQMICTNCHLNYKTGTLAGRQHGNPKELGDFSSGNITQDSVTGIGNWTNSQLYYFFKTGIKPDGTYVFDMPKYINLSDDDIYNIISFLRSEDTLVHKTFNKTPEPQFSNLTKVMLHTLLTPPEYVENRIPNPDTNNILQWGKYLATAKFSCYTCHSLNSLTTNEQIPEKSWGYFRGHNPHSNEDREEIFSANITGDSISGIGKWTEKEFIRTLKTGIKPNNTNVRDPMFPFYLLTDNEAKAIYTYLKTLR